MISFSSRLELNEYMHGPDPLAVNHRAGVWNDYERVVVLETHDRMANQILMLFSL